MKTVLFLSLALVGLAAPPVAALEAATADRVEVGAGLPSQDNPGELVASFDALQFLHQQFACEFEEAREFELESQVPILLWVLDVEGLPARSGASCTGNAFEQADLSALLSAMRSLELPMLC